MNTYSIHYLSMRGSHRISQVEAETIKGAIDSWKKETVASEIMSITKI